MLEIVGVDNKNKWDKIVTSFKEYDVYYLCNYAYSFKLHGDGEPLLFYYSDNNTRAINVVMKRDIADDKSFKNIAKGKYYDFITPYGYGGWIIEGNENIELLFKEYFNWCKNNKIVSEIIRFHPMLNNQNKVNSIYDIVNLGETVFIDLESEETMWNNFTSKNRNVIRKAIKNNVIIINSLNKETMNDFIDIYNKTMDRDSADDYYYFNKDFFQSIINGLNEYTKIFYAMYKNKIIASSIILMANNKLNYHLSGSLKEYGNLAATNLLLYEVAKWGNKNGYKTLHLGGGVGSKKDSLFSFKKAFNKNSGKQYCIGKLIFNKDAYNMLVSLRNGSKMRENFFPLYRA